MLRMFAGGRLFGSRTGEEPARVLALHGWGRTHRDFDAVLAPSGEVPLDALAVDLPGFGASPPPPEAWGSGDFAACLDEVVSVMATPTVVLAHSFGGRVALHLAAARPDRIGALVLTGVPLARITPRPASPPAFRLVRRLHRLGLVGNDRMEGARRRYGSPDYRNAQGVMRQVLVRTTAETYEHQLESLTCPVTCVWGDDDTTVPPAVAEAAMARVRGAHPSTPTELVLVPGAGHLLPLSAPVDLRSAVERMLAQVGTTGP